MSVQPKNKRDSLLPAFNTMDSYYWWNYLCDNKMKKDWEIKKLGEIAKVSAGQSAPQDKSLFTNNGNPFIRAGNLEALVNGLNEQSLLKIESNTAEKFKLKLFPKNSIIFAKSGMSASLNRVHVLKENCYVVSHLAVLEIKKDFPSFIKYHLMYNPPSKLIKDEGYPSISLYDIQNLEIPIPPLPVQEKIVAELDTLHRLKELQEQQLTELNNLAQSTFYDMFGDPIENEKGWEVKKFGNIFSLKSGVALSAKNIIDGEYPVYGGNGIVGYHNVFNTEGVNIIIGRVGALCGNVRLVSESIWLTDNAFKLNLVKENFDLIFLRNLLSIFDLRKFAREALQPVISNLTLKNIEVIIPPLSLQTQFAERIEKIESQKELIKQSIAQTQHLIDYTMDKYFG